MQYNWPLIGHDNVKRYFEKAFAAGRVHHAYLFEGPAQVGKATFARMLAKALLCGGERTRPCGSCRACEAYDHGAHPDVLVFNRGEEASVQIEPIREFIAAMQTKPLLGKYRIGILEEAELLTLPAANALLKTLEEPAKSAVLFLISHTEVLPTIASRCQRIRFGFVAADEIEAHCSEAADRQEAARLAGGRPGRARDLCAPGAQEAYLEELEAIARIIEAGEAERLLWISQALRGRKKDSEEKDINANLLFNLQMILRRRCAEGHFKFGAMLTRSLNAERLLRANVDPRTIWNYLLLN